MRELKFIEHFNKNNDLYQMVKIYVWCWMHIFLIFNTLNFYGMLKLLFICTDDTFYLREN